jgi:hypothetical protein
VCATPYRSPRTETTTCSLRCGVTLRDFNAERAPHTVIASLVPWDTLALRTKWWPPCPCGARTPNARRRLCDTCRDAARRARKSYASRARKYAVPYDPTVTLEAVAARDGWRCHVCTQPIRPNAHAHGTIDPQGPSIDHLLAMSHGGPHSWDNVALAHHACNTRRWHLEQAA